MTRKHWYLVGFGGAAVLLGWLVWRRSYKTIQGIVAIAYNAPNGEVLVGREPLTVLGDQQVRTLGSAQNGFVPIVLSGDLITDTGSVGSRAGTWWMKASDLA
jgi:hypothetical protein